MRAFRHQRDSLRLSASSVAAMSGYHPFASIPKILMDLIYQGKLGRELFYHDCKLLGLRITTDEEILLELATKAGSSTKNALELALKVKKGTSKVDTSDGANVLKQKVLEEAKASQKLTSTELSILQDGVRDSVNTGYGNFHEEEALNMYEKQCGWEINERNERIMCWPFVKAEDLELPRTDNPSDIVPTVVPLSQATPYCRLEDSGESSSEDSCTSCDNKVTHLRRQRKRKENANGETLPESEGDEINCQKNDDASSVDPNPKPFFSIVGSVDGILEELYCQTPSGDEDQQSPQSDGWRMRQIVVECKHRMKSAKVPPPLYDQIQTTVYCLMYKVDEADIVQVVRKHARPTVDKDSQQMVTNAENTSSTPEKSDESETPGSTDGASEKPVSPEADSRSSDDVIETKRNIRNAVTSRDAACTTIPFEYEKRGTKTGNAPECTASQKASQESSVEESGDVGDCTPTTRDASAASTGNTQKGNGNKISDRNGAPAIDIVVTRVSVDDPIMQHRPNWINVILPRLRSFVEAVYRVRENDDKRYQLLVAMSGATSDHASDDAWNILHQECPWLMDCDTAYFRRQPS